MTSMSGRQALIYSLLLGGLCISFQAYGADGTGVLNNIADRYQAQASAWQGAISAAATRLFWSLALISMVWTFGMMALRKADIQEMFAELVRYLMFTGFFFFLLSNASAIAKAIMNSLTQLASTASGLPPITPSGIMDVGFNVLATVLSKSSLWSPVDSALGIAVGLIILVVLALVAINMLILLVSGWILAYAGIFFLGFGGSRWTSDMAINYYKTVLGIAASLMGMTLIVGIGQAFLNEYYASIGDASFSDLAVILVVALVLLHLVNKIPTLISGIITGASVGSASAMGGAGAGTALAAAAMAGAAAAGAVAAMASSATSAAGWGSAVNAAIRQGGGDSGKDTGVSGMPNMASAGSGTGDDGNASVGTSTPLGTAMGDTGSTGAASFNSPSGATNKDMPAAAQDTQSNDDHDSNASAGTTTPIGTAMGDTGTTDAAFSSSPPGAGSDDMPAATDDSGRHDSNAGAGTTTPIGTDIGDTGSTDVASSSSPPGAASDDMPAATDDSGGHDSNASAGTTTPTGADIGDTGSTDAASSSSPPDETSNDMPATTQDTQDSGGHRSGSDNATAKSSESPVGDDVTSAPEGRSAGPGKAGRSVLGVLGAGIAAVASGKAGSVMDSVRHQVAQTTGGKVAAEIRSPGSAAAERQNKADIHNSQTIAGKAQAARAFMATGLSSSPIPPAFTGDSLAAFNNPETSIDADAEISAFVNRTSA